MVIDIGYFALLASIGVVLYSIAAAGVGIAKNSGNLIQSAHNALLAKFALVCIAYAALTYAFVTDDFSTRFVAMHSSTDLPLFYKITAVWGGMEGSLLLWETMLSAFTAIVIVRYSKSNSEILPHTVVILASISLFLLILLAGWSNPLDTLYPAPAEGNGLNPLLQNPGMIYHPPSLYIGYVGFSVPFAFALGSLLRGKLDNRWILTTRRWTLFSWFFLTLGMVLGGDWAYLELGWGGYWAWDPVENASLLPWLTGTAFLHSAIVQEKRNRLKIWNMLLIIATFTLSILGTFITRSGVLNSVHSFAKSNIGPAFLVFIAITLVVANILLKMRLPLLVSKARPTGFITKENSFLLNNILFTGMAFTVLYGTVFPLLAEGLADKKISIQAPFFNTIMLPLGLIMTGLMGISHILGWKRTSTLPLIKNMAVPAFAATLPTGAAVLLLPMTWQVPIAMWITLFTGTILVIELAQSNRTIHRHAKRAWTSWIFRNRRKKGGLILHLAVISITVGIYGNFYNQETSFSFSPGETKAFGDYLLKFDGIERFREHNTQREGVRVEVFQNGQSIGTLLPMKAYYPTSPQPMTEVAIRRSIREDLYLSLSSINQDGSATINAYINPLVNFVWAGMALICFGILFSLSHIPVQLRKRGA